MNPKEIFDRVNPDIRDFADLEKFLDRREMSKFRKSFIEKITVLIISAFGLVAAFAWDSALKEVFNIIFTDLTVLQEKFLYACVITIFAVLTSIFLSKLFLKESSEEIKLQTPL